MGLFWDLIQQSQISSQERKSASIEERVAWLEGELERTQDLVYKLLDVLENHFGRDIDGDGRIA